jgi:ParB family chromosome partitioning protein
MSDATGHIELERSVDSIMVGVRHRTDLGDLGPLMRSIERLGLLQPVTITTDGVLICGRRRLEAVKRLGWRTLRVWVRSGLSDHLTRLLAQQDENALHKPLSPVEAASLYRELKKVMAEDAARRQEATRFGAEGDSGGMNGAADSAGPERGFGDARRQAADLVTQNASYTRLEQISAIERIAADQTQPTKIRQLAESELERIRDGGAVDPSYQRVRAAIQLLAHDSGDSESPADPEDLESLAAEALARAKEERARRVRENRQKRAAGADQVRRSVRSFVLTWSDLQGWTKHYDATEVGQQLSDDDWAMFEGVLEETCAFAEAARRARAKAAAPASA